jgi:hypothetical protein
LPPCIGCGKTKPPQRPTISSHAKKVPIKRETLKLATVGAVGIDANPNNSVLVMDPNAVVWNYPAHL